MENKPNEAVLLLNAIDFAANKHKDQRRKNLTQDPYIGHPIGVARMIANIGKVENIHILIAAILHDTVEDTKTTKEELIKLFGEKVANTVMEVTDDKTLNKIARKQLQITHAKEISWEAKMVKLGDKLNNLSSMAKDAPVSWSVEIIQGYFVWAKCVVNNLRGTNEFLEKELDKVFNSTFEKNGKVFSCLPDKPLDIALAEYYHLLAMEGKKD